MSVCKRGSNDRAAVTAGDNDYPLIVPVSFLQGQPFWVCLHAGSTFNWNLAPQVNGSRFNDDVFADGPSDPFGASTPDNQKAPVFVIFLSAATAGILPNNVVVDPDIFYAPLTRPVNTIFSAFMGEEDTFWLPEVFSGNEIVSAQMLSDDAIYDYTALSWVDLFCALFDESVNDLCHVPFVHNVAGPNQTLFPSMVSDSDTIYSSTNN